MGADHHRLISDLIVDYGFHLDTGNIDAVADMFANATLRILRGDEELAVATGSDEVRALLGDHTDHDGSPRTHHVNTNVRINLSEDAMTATARTYITLLQATKDLPLQPVACGIYHDRFVREGDVWRFAERRNEARLLGDLSHRLRGGANERLAHMAAGDRGAPA